MNTEKNKAIIRSLTGRLIRKGTTYELPSGILSEDEVNALRQFGGVTPIDDNDTELLSPELILTALDAQGPEEEEIRLCLDFGTAMSKAWASRREDEETIPLVLGQIARTGNTLVVPSTVYISQSGRIYFGASAETQHRQEMETGRLRFDNLKQMLSEAEVGQELDDVLLPPETDPTQSGLSQGDLLVLYLAWLTDLALKALKDKVDGATVSGSLRYVRRRFAIPCFEHAQDETVRGEERAKWAKSVMERAILRAQIVADTLTDEWEGLTVYHARSLMLKCRRVDKERERLLYLLAESAPVREPVAAGASRFNQMVIEDIGDFSNELVRMTLLIIDAGAGTTDFALFQTFRKHNEEIRYGLIAPSVRMCRVAGNNIDSIIRPLALEACKVDIRTRKHDEARNINISLDSQLRDIKHNLFEKQEANIELPHSASGILRLESVSQDSEYKARGRELLEVRKEIIQSIFSGQLNDLQVRLGGVPYPIHVLLTGGSAPLPIIRDLATGGIAIEKVSFRFSKVEKLPDWIDTLPRDEAALITDRYPQCAVAIGGSVRELPQEITDLDYIIVPPPPGQRYLESYR